MKLKLKLKLSAVIVVGFFSLAGCGDAEGSVEATQKPSPDPCFLNTQVAGLPFDWGYDIAGPREYASNSEKAELANNYAEKVKELSWGVPEGSDCTGYRESLVFTKELFVLVDALKNGVVEEAHYENASRAGGEFMKVMKLEEQGYSTEQLEFPTRIDPTKQP